MKGKMYSEKSHVYLQKNLLDASFNNHQNIKNLRRSDIIQDDEYITLLEKNMEWLIQKIKEFRIAEKIVCVFFALLFGYMQINSDDSIERARRSRSRSGRRKNEYVNPRDI